MKSIPENSAAIKKIYSRLKPGNPVLLQIRGKHFSAKKQNGKAPILNGWQTITWDQTQEPAYQGTLRRRARAIGVALGSQSGGIYTIDIDDDAAVGDFLKANPWAENTLRTRGARGCQFWVWIKAGAPKKKIIFR